MVWVHGHHRVEIPYGGFFMKKIIILGLLGVIPLLLIAQKVERKIIGSGETLRIGSGKGGISSSVRGGVTAGVQGPSDIIITMEGGANGTIITTNVLHTFTTGLSFGSSSGVYQIISNLVPVVEANTLTISTAQAARGTRSMRVDCSIDNHYALFKLGTSNSIMSAGMAIRLDALWTGATFNSYNFYELHFSGGTEFNVFNFFDNPGFEFAIQTSAGLSVGKITGLSNNTWYWATIKWDGQDGLGTLNMYNYIGSGSLGTFMGSVSNGMFITTAPERFQFGRADNHGVFNPGAFIYLDDVVLRYDGAFPVLPP